MTESPADETPPGVVLGTWHEAHAAIAAAALGQLRLAGDDHDAARIAGKVPGALGMIDRDLELRPATGRVTYTVGGVAVVTYAPGDAPADILEAAVQLTVELYRRKDVAFGVLVNSSASYGEPTRVSRQQLAGVDSLLAPYREGWGIG